MGSAPRHTLVNADALVWLRAREGASLHGIVTDPPYGLVEYSAAELENRRNGGAGIWRLPQNYDGRDRRPVPRFTVLSERQVAAIGRFFDEFSALLLSALVPGAHVFVASNPLVSYRVIGAFAAGGFEVRGQIVRLVQTLRGGDRPKGAHEVFPELSVTPGSSWEPWLLFRKPLEGRVQDNLRRWHAGALRRPESGGPFRDVIPSGRTPQKEREIADHPSLKPQRFLRQIVRAVLPLGVGIVGDPFCGSGSTLAAATAVGYESIGVERDLEYFKMAVEAVPKLAALYPSVDSPTRVTGVVAKALGHDNR